MADQVEEIKSKTDIVALIADRIQLTKAGRNYRALCPFHGEKTPSFMVSPELQIYKCFGCQAGGDAISFLEEYEGMDFGEAISYLAEKAGIKLEKFKGDQKTQKEALYELNLLAAKFYNYLLVKHPIGKDALEYLTRERSISPETIKLFMLGFAPLSFHSLQDFLAKKKINKLDLEKSGLVVYLGGRPTDRFRGRVIFPLFNNQGNAVGLAGRILPNIEKNLSKQASIAKYINSPETLVYHKGNLLYGLNITRGEIKREGKAVLVEGEIDAISSWQAGVKNVVAIKGTAFTEEQARVLSRITKVLILALDSDLAGNDAARRSIKIAQNLGLEIKVARLGSFKDPDDAARNNKEDYKKMLEEAIGVWDFLIGTIFSKYSTNKGLVVENISREVIPVLSDIDDKIVQARYIESVARKLSVPTEAVLEQLNKYTLTKKTQTPVIASVSPRTESERKSRREILEENLLKLAFQFDPASLTNEEYRSMIKTPLCKRLVSEFNAFYTKGIVFNPGNFAQKLPKELLDGFTRLVFSADDDKIRDQATFEKEIMLVAHELRSLDLKEQLEEKSKLIQKLESSGQKAELKKAKQEFSKLSTKLVHIV